MLINIKQGDIKMENRINLSGKRFGRWVVIDRAEKKNRKYYWLCRCDCGSVRAVQETSLLDGSSKSCGCLQKEAAAKTGSSRKENLIGQRFGRLIVTKRIEYIKEKHGTLWECQCDCGNITHVLSFNLKNGKTQSCGCLKKDTISFRQTTHGDSLKRLYRIWRGMITRCYNVNAPNYKRYGGRGITIIDEWRTSYESFRDWALSHGYSEDLSIDRINNNNGYSPDNCRWATRVVQCNNRRSNVLISYQGETHTAKEWGNIFGIKGSILARRKSRGWTDEECIEVPVISNANHLVREKFKKGMI